MPTSAAKCGEDGLIICNICIFPFKKMKKYSFKYVVGTICRFVKPANGTNNVDHCETIFARPFFEEIPTIQ